MPNEKCPLCEKQVEVSAERDSPLLNDYSSHNPCGRFCMFGSDGEILSDAMGRERWQPERIIALLYERRLRNAGAVNPLLLLQMPTRREIPGTERLRVSELLAQWPKTFQGRLDRAFSNLVRRSGENIGSKIGINEDGPDRHLFFATGRDEVRFLRETMTKYEWIKELEGRYAPTQFEVAPAGWRHFDELSRRGNRNNPVFVAMWFGGDDANNQERMRQLFEEGIKAACNKLGWVAERVDSQEHNDSIMDRIIAMIRQAPFVIADLSDGNRGVYYEAGFARGLGCDVIYLAREEAEVHFDLSGVNHVKWSGAEDLRTKLENRILGSMGRGPHKSISSMLDRCMPGDTGGLNG